MRVPSYELPANPPGRRFHNLSAQAEFLQHKIRSSLPIINLPTGPRPSNHFPIPTTRHNRSPHDIPLPSFQAAGNPPQNTTAYTWLFSVNPLLHKDKQNSETSNFLNYIIAFLCYFTLRRNEFIPKRKSAAPTKKRPESRHYPALRYLSDNERGLYSRPFICLSNALYSLYLSIMPGSSRRRKLIDLM